MADNPTLTLVKPQSKNIFPKTGIGPAFVKKVMPWVEQFWHVHNRYPSVVDFAEKFGFTADQVKLMDSSKFWLNCLDSRGITRPTHPEDYLSDRQIAALALITNFNDTRGHHARLAAINVTEEELNGWYSNPHFKKALAERADDILENVAPSATTELARQIQRGNFQALKFWYEITGRAQSPEAINVKMAMQVLVEAVQKHVKDPEILEAIGKEVQSIRSIQGVQ